MGPIQFYFVHRFAMNVFNSFQEVLETYLYLLSKAHRSHSSCICIGETRNSGYVDCKYTIQSTNRRIHTKAHQVAVLLRLGRITMPQDTEA